jgi:hypothetical protein
MFKLPITRFIIAAAAILTPTTTAQNLVAFPPSTLLAPGVTTLPLQLNTSTSTACKWDATNVPYSKMSQTFLTTDGIVHTTTLDGISGDLINSVFYVQCEAYASDAPLVLAYRSLPDSDNAPFPRLGNLWGSYNFQGHPEGLSYAAERSSLWLGSSWNQEEISQLRSLNKYTIVLTSINACEVNDQDLPDEFYLLNITQPPSTRGRLQSWPGAWRLDLTNPAVQNWQAQLMYCLVIFGGSGYGSNPGCANATVPPMIFDGLFVDNVFMDDGASVNAFDIFNNPFIPINHITGEPYQDFNQKWKDGMIAMIQQFRRLMPLAILDGHAMDILDPNISNNFNAISIGFTTVEILERYQSFSSGLATYNQWMTMPVKTPRITMIESAVRFQLGYGYGFNNDLSTDISQDCLNSHSIPGAPMPGIGDACYPTTAQKPGYLLPQTFMTARSEYQYFRFGLGFTLMQDGYFTHELGDSWHGQDWDYDELHFFLGYPRGNATSATIVDPNPPPIPPNVPIDQNWFLYVRSPNSSNASWTFDSTERPSTSFPPSVRVDINNTAPSNDGIDLSQVLNFESGGYQLAFWAKSSVDGTPVQLNSRKNGGDWHNFGLDQPIVLTPSWQLFNITFLSVSDGTPGRLSWFLGSAAPGTSVWINSPTLTGVIIPPPVLYREFDCGTVVLNGDTQNHTVLLQTGSLRRLNGQQAPRYQYFVDDNSSQFQIVSGDWTVSDFNNGYKESSPSQEQVRPSNGYFHHWRTGAHQAPAGGSAIFTLNIPVSGVYNLSMWWPAAVPARSSWSQALKVTVNPGSITTTVNLSTQGGDMFFPLFGELQLDPTSTLQIDCPTGGGTCIADAILIESIARWNDGSAEDSVFLQPMDAIILQRINGAPSSCNAQEQEP